MRAILFSIILFLIGYRASAQLSPLAIGEIAPGKTLVVTYDVTVNNPTSASVITNQGVISGTNFASVSTNTTNTPIVSSNANLSVLAISPGTLSPPFVSSVTAYTASVPNSASSVAVTPTVEQANATLAVNGTAVASGSPINVPLAVCANAISVSVTAQDGTTTKVYTITVNRDAPPVSLTASSPLSCTATIVTLTATPGFASYTFGEGATQGSPSNTATISTSGVYSVTAIATEGCSSTATVPVTGSTTPTSLSLTASGPISCVNPTVTLTATSGLLSYTFSEGASQGSPINTAVVSVSGVYSVSATNASYCISTATITVTGSSVGSPVSLTSNGPISCPNPTVTLTATPGFVSYRFSGDASQAGGLESHTATVSTAGVYSVTATDANACTSTNSVTVTGSSASTPVSLTASGPISCTAPSATLTATPGFVSYVFSDNASQQDGSGGNTATVNTAGTYSVTATNANACSSTANVGITGSTTAPTLSLSNDGALTCNQTRVNITFTNTGTLSVVTPPGATQDIVGNQLRVSVPGTYTFTATDPDNSCSTTKTSTVESNTTAPQNVTLINNGPLTCSQTMATLTASSSSTGSLSYSFTGSSPISQDGSAVATVTNAGTYTVTVTGANGCSATMTTLVESNTTAPQNVTLVNDEAITCAKQTVQLTASSSTTGILSFTFGGPPSSSITQNGSSVATANGSGTYTVTVTGPNGCTATATTMVLSNTTAPQNVTLTNNGPLTCALPSVTLLAGPSTQSNYAFSGPDFSQSGTNATATVTTSGTYSVIVTGANGCTATTTTTVAGNSQQPTVTLTSSGPLSFTNSIVTLTASSTGNVSYSFSQGASQQNGGNTATVTTAGVYSVTVVRQDNGCTATASTTVLGGNNPTVCRGGTAVINVAVEGDPIRYEWYKNTLTSPKLMETPQLFRGTATSSLTLINAQSNTQGNFFLKVTDRSGTVRVYGPFRLTVDASCRAREVASLETLLQVELAPNPIQQDRLRAIVRGGEGRSLQVELLDLSGKPIRQQRWQQAEPQQVIDWDMQGQSNGLYLLQVISEGGAGLPAQRQSVKVVKP
ncbi:cadherin-like beta sandwich domain-containing protein [Spirosoma fluminis]